MRTARWDVSRDAGDRRTALCCCVPGQLVFVSNDERGRRSPLDLSGSLHCPSAKLPSSKREVTIHVPLVAWRRNSYAMSAVILFSCRIHELAPADAVPGSVAWFRKEQSRGLFCQQYCSSGDLAHTVGPPLRTGGRKPRSAEHELCCIFQGLCVPRRFER